MPSWLFDTLMALLFLVIIIGWIVTDNGGEW